MKPLRLALMGHYPSSTAPKGGVETVTANLVGNLIQRDEIDLHVIQHRGGVQSGQFDMGKFVLHNLAIEHRRLIPNNIKSIRVAREALEWIRPDAVSSHHPSFTLAALSLGLPVIHTIHGFPLHEFRTRRTLFTFAASLSEIWLEWRMLRQVNHVVAISDLVIDIYRDRTGARFHRINNPIAPLFFQPSPIGIPGQFLLVGNLTPRKGIDVAIDVIARLHDQHAQLRLDIVGAEADRAYVRQLRLQAAPLGDAVRFHGVLSQETMKETLGHAQALLLTSHAEHAPMIVAEAMASSRPVVATRVGALADMIEPGVTGFLAPAADITALAAYVTQLLESPSLSRNLGENARQYARQRYHPATVTDAYLNALDQAVRERSSI